ncbi:MAG TPA: 30S ribosomal protein S4 [Conexivisphaerales archaeon]|nr:30S ribosomal protein S4 [Conexivisphaerales archaeon]
MGDPKKPRRTYTTPRNPWSADQLSRELFLVGTYGLRNKRELWKIETELSRIRKQARELLAAPPEVRQKQSVFLIDRLVRMGLVAPNSAVDDLLSLKVEDLLERRLQTLVWRKGIAKSPYQARQLVSHKHILINGKLMTKPNYLVARAEEDAILVTGGGAA